MTAPLVPGSPEWCRVVTASKVAAILGHSPFESQRSIWHSMRGEYTPTTTAAMERGNYLEAGVLQWWRDQHPEFPVTREQPQWRLGEWAAATPDMLAGPKGCTSKKLTGAVLVEAKTSADDREWGDPGTDQIPAHYLTQCFWSMHLSGIHEIRVPVLTSRLVFVEYVVRHDPEIGRLLVERCRTFYDTLTAAVPPPLDDTLSTFECMRALHPDIEDGLAVEVSRDLALSFLTAARDKTDAEARERFARSQLLDLAGHAQYLTCQGIRIAARERKGAGVSLVRKAKSPDQIPTTEQETAA